MSIIKKFLNLFLTSKRDTEYHLPSTSTQDSEYHLSSANTMDPEYQRMVSTYGSDSPVTPKKHAVKTIWNKWPEHAHYTSDQYWRRKRGLEETIPLCVDLDELTGKFLGSQGELYETTLTSCDCGDFANRNLPCKHIYRLFSDIESGNSLSFEVGVDNAVMMERDKNHGNLRTAHPAKTINGIPVSAIQFLVSISQELIEKQYIYISKRTSDIDELINCGILSDSTERDYVELLNYMTKDQILLGLAKKSISGHRPSWAKSKLISWIVENQSEFLKRHFKKTLRLVIQENQKAYVQKLYENNKSRNFSPADLQIWNFK